MLADHLVKVDTLNDEFETQRNGFKNGVRTRSLRAQSDGGCIAWVIESRAPGITVHARICHAGDRAKHNPAEFARGRAVPEFNQGQDLVHTFWAPAQRLEIDLEKLATKDCALLKNYTNPGGLTVTLLVSYRHLQEEHNVFGGDVKIIGPTKRKRALQATPGSQSKLLKSRFTVMEEKCESPHASTGSPLTRISRAPFVDLTPNPNAHWEDLKDIKPSSELRSLYSDELACMADMQCSRESCTVEPVEFQGDLPDSVDPIAIAMNLPIARAKPGPVEFLETVFCDNYP